MNVLKLATAGSVDDGKSTLIGRLLYDTHALTKDRLEAVAKASKRKGLDFIDLSLLTDGLVAEREQGITIDVAHIYFHTNKRKFILADTPGHIEYTRNMITGASNAELSIILIDARKGVVEQTYRHFFINILLRVPNIIVCINKMDLVDYSEEVFYKTASDFQKLSQATLAKFQTFPKFNLNFIPISALHGDNITHLSKKMPWYIGKPLLEILEEVDTDKDWNSLPARFPVQYVIRRDDKEFPDYRGYAGKVISGTFQVGDKVTILPNQLESTITEIRLFEDTSYQAFAHDSVAISLADEIDVSRGSMIVKSSELPIIAQELQAKICWLSESPYRVGTTFVLKHASSEVKAKIQEISYKADMGNFRLVDENTSDNAVEDEFNEPIKINEIKLNDIVKVNIRTSQPIFYDLYAENKANGAFILIDSQTNATVAVGFLE
jgi:sulfate adenylyltransferase subunit 1